MGYEHRLWDDTDVGAAGGCRVSTAKGELGLVTSAPRYVANGWRWDRRRSMLRLRGVPYQQRAIRCDLLSRSRTIEQRKALVVMATGCGQDPHNVIAYGRSVACGRIWAKRVLFLADRTALVTPGSECVQSEHLA